MSESPLWIWGRHPVMEALQTGRVRGILVSSAARSTSIVREISREALETGVPMRFVSPSELDEIAPGQNTQGVVAEVNAPDAVDLDAMCSSISSSGKTAFLLALDQIQDPHNIGALMRTADAVGIDGIVLPEHRSAPLSGTVAKVSAGAMSYLQVAMVPNLVRAIEFLQQQGIWVVGLDGDARQSLFDADLTVPLALIVGSEGEGLRRLTRERCDYTVKLPMLGHIASLNASVAGSIAMYEVLRQRTAKSR